MAEFLGNIPFLTIIYLMPLCAVIALFFIPGTNHKAVKVVSLVFSVLSFIMSLLLFISYDYKKGGLQFVEHFDWIPAIGVNYFMGVNGINVALCF